MKDLYSKLAVIGATVAAPTDNTAVAGPIVDRQKYESILFVVCTGTLADVDATFAGTIAESDNSNMSSSNAVDASDLLGALADISFTFDNDNVQRKLGYRGNKRYVQPTITPSANSGAAPITIVALGVPLLQPAA